MARHEVMDWCDDQGIDYVFGLPGNAVLTRAVEAAVDHIRTPSCRDDQSIACVAIPKSAMRPNRGKPSAAPAPVSRRLTLGLDIRFVVTRPCHPFGRIYLRCPLLRTRSGRESDQDAQGPNWLPTALLRAPLANQMRLIPAHCRLLADVDAARCHPQDPRLGQGRVQHPAPPRPEVGGPASPKPPPVSASHSPQTAPKRP